MWETEEEREQTESTKALTRYELVRRRIPYGEGDSYGVYEVPITDYVMLDFGLLEETRNPDGHRVAGANGGFV